MIECTKCPRLVAYRTEVASRPPRSFRGSSYWSRPVPGYGDPDAKLIIIGLAPAANGGNRTGRVFTGDATSKLLAETLYRSGFSNQPRSESKNDGLRLRAAYMTAAVKCAPPQNKPTKREESNCSAYLEEELEIIRSAEAVLVLGRLAFYAYINYLSKKHSVDRGKFTFKHGAVCKFSKGIPTLFVSYHPSPRNIRTGKLKIEEFRGVFRRIKKHLESS